jgi:hypothetical protein
MAETGIDHALKLEAIYFSAPIPRNPAVLTVLGAVFDKVYFPGVHLPTEGFDVSELDKEVARLEGLPPGGRDYDRELLIGALKLTKHAKTLDGFCVFDADPDDIFAQKSPLPAGMVEAIYEAIHGPPPPGFIPSFDTGHAKGIPGSDATVIYPGAHHYIARALILAGRTGIPILNDIPGLPVPGLTDTAPIDDAKLLAASIAIECTRLVLPPLSLLRPEDLMEFREANTELLRGFRRSMLRYAADLNAQIKGLTRKDFEEKTKFFIETKIVPAMDELNAAMNDPARPWHKRAIDAIKIIPAVGGAYMTGGTAAALAKALTATAAQFFVEVAAKGDKEEALKRSGLTYLLQLKAFHDRRS